MRRGRFQLALCAALLAAGCDSQGAQQNAQANIVNEAASADGSGRAWLVGRWQAGEGACAPGDTYFTLEADGRYAFMEEQGRWTLDGDRLTVEVTHASPDSGVSAGQRSVTIVRQLGPNEAEFAGEGRSPIRVTRCAG